MAFNPSMFISTTPTRGKMFNRYDYETADEIDVVTMPDYFRARFHDLRLGDVITVMARLKGERVVRHVVVADLTRPDVTLVEIGEPSELAASLVARVHALEKQVADLLQTVTEPPAKRKAA